MGRKAGVLTLVLIILILVSLSLAAGGYYLYQKEHVKAADLETKVEELVSKQKITEGKLRESQKTVTEIQGKLQDANTQVESLTNDLQKEKTDKEAALAKTEQLNSDLDQQKQLKSDLEAKLSKAEQELKKAQSLLKEITANKTALESKIKELETKPGVELGEVVVNPEAAVPVGEAKSNVDAAVLPKPDNTAVKAKGLEGKIMIVNKDYNFAVINLGVKDGVQTGNIFSVYHGNKSIGELKVEKVHDSMSAAGFSSPDMKELISEGDTVKEK